MRKYYDLFNILNLGGIRGCNLTKEDADISFKIFGPSVTKGKGNTTRQSAKLSPSSIVSVPRELIRAQEEVVLCIDFFFINQKHIFLTTYSEEICFTTNSHVVNRKVKSYWPMLKFGQGVKNSHDQSRSRVPATARARKRTTDEARNGVCSSRDARWASRTEHSVWQGEGSIASIHSPI